MYISSLVWCEKWTCFCTCLGISGIFWNAESVASRVNSSYPRKDRERLCPCVLLRQFGIWLDLYIFKTKKVLQASCFVLFWDNYLCIQPDTLCFDCKMSLKYLYFEDIQRHNLIHPCMFPAPVPYIFHILLWTIWSQFPGWMLCFQPRPHHSFLLSHLSPLRHHFHAVLLVSRTLELRGEMCLEECLLQVILYVCVIISCLFFYLCM